MAPTTIVVLTARDGQVVRLRDYVDILAATAAVQAQP
jgi:ketosteroid isomerase-like protein